MELAASTRVFQISGRCPRLFLWHLAVSGKCYNFHHLLLPNGSNGSSCQEDKNQQSGIFFDLCFFWIWNGTNGALSTVLERFLPLGFICYVGLFCFLSVYFKIKLLFFFFFYSVCRQHILHSVLTAVQNECKLITN